MPMIQIYSSPVEFVQIFQSSRSPAAMTNFNFNFNIDHTIVKYSSTSQSVVVWAPACFSHHLNYIANDDHRQSRIAKVKHYLPEICPNITSKQPNQHPRGSLLGISS